MEIKKNSKEFSDVILAYYKKYGKILTVDSMIYYEDSGMYYMQNEYADYTFHTKRIIQIKQKEKMSKEQELKQELKEMYEKTDTRISGMEYLIKY